MTKKKPIKILSAKSNYMFKEIFGNEENIDLLKLLLEDLIEFEKSELESIKLIDPHINKKTKKVKKINCQY